MPEGGLDTQPKEALQIETLESHIGKGLDAIKSGDYKIAISLFSDSEAARQAGLSYEDKPSLALVKRTPQNEEDVNKIIDVVGSQSWFNEPTAEKPTASIKTSTVFVLEPGMYGVTEPVILTPEVEKTIYHNVALLNAEEWIHALRSKQGTELEDTELDEAGVALYLLQKGVPLTDRFLDQYNRKKHLAQKQG